MFRTRKTAVEKGRLAAHDGAEAGMDKLHQLIDKVAERAEGGSERAGALGALTVSKRDELRDRALEAHKELRARTQEARKDLRKQTKAARKDLRSQVKSARKDLKIETRDAVKASKKLGKQTQGRINDAGGDLRALGASALDEASSRGSATVRALKDDRDPQAALDAIKGVRPKPSRAPWVIGLLLLGGGAAFAAKRAQDAKKAAAKKKAAASAARPAAAAGAGAAAAAPDFIEEPYEPLGIDGLPLTGGGAEGTAEGTTPTE